MGMGGCALLKLQPWACSSATSLQHPSPATKGHTDPFRGNRFAQVGVISEQPRRLGFQLCVLSHTEICLLLRAPSCITTGQQPLSPGPRQNRLSDGNRCRTLVHVLFHKPPIL